MDTPDSTELIAQCANVLYDGYIDSAIFEDIESFDALLTELHRIAAEPPTSPEASLWITLAEVSGNAAEGQRAVELRYQIIEAVAALDAAG